MAKKIHVRPSKSQSKIGFIVGTLFCLIGVFIAIPNFGLFGVVWTAVAGLIAYTNYRNGYTDRPIDTREIEIEENGEDITVTSRSGLHPYSYEWEETKTKQEYAEDRLRKVMDLYSKSLITREEYEHKKKEILDEL